MLAEGQGDTMPVETRACLKHHLIKCCSSPGVFIPVNQLANHSVYSCNHPSGPYLCTWLVSTCFLFVCFLSLTFLT